MGKVKERNSLTVKFSIPKCIDVNLGMKKGKLIEYFASAQNLEYSNYGSKFHCTQIMSFA